MNKELIANFIDDAADYMENHGSTSGKLEDESGRVCMLGALARIARIEYDSGFTKYHSGAYSEAQFAVVMFLDVTNNGSGSISSYSDTHSHQERLDAFRKCAKGLRP